MRYPLLFTLLITSIGGATGQTSIFTHTEKHFIPEGITLNPTDGKIYVSSIALKKIVAIDASGATQDFIKTNQDGFLEGLGMKIDQKKQWLWAVSNQKQGKLYTSQVHAFDLKTGSLKQKHVVNDTTPRLFNDLVLHPNGNVYVTDTNGASIYEVDSKKQKLKLFIKDELLARANGIAINDKGTIYIATKNGLVRFDMRSKKLSQVTFSDSKKAMWMDGIVYKNNSIIGVVDDAIMQYDLNEQGDQLIKERIIDSKNQHFNGPTTAALLKNKLYVIANSYLGPYNDNKESVAGIEDKLDSVVVLVYTLDDL